MHILSKLVGFVLVTPLAAKRDFAFTYDALTFQPRDAYCASMCDVRVLRRAALFVQTYRAWHGVVGGAWRNGSGQRM